MKLSYKLGAAAIVAVAGVAMVIPNTTQALDGTGHIQFTFDASSNTGLPTIPDITHTDETTDGNSDITSNSTLPVTNPGDFGMVAVSPLEFGSHDVVTGIAADGTYTANAYIANEGAYETANFVQFQDYRAGGTNGYNITATISSQFSSGANTLTGSTLEYKAITVKNQNSNITGLAPSAVPSQTVTADASAPFVTNTANGQTGYGSYALVFNAADQDNGVDLTIPSDQATITNGDYNATITWTMVNA